MMDMTMDSGAGGGELGLRLKSLRFYYIFWDGLRRY